MSHKNHLSSLDPLLRPSVQSITAKDALKASSAQLKQLLGHKLDKIKKKEKKGMQLRVRVTTKKVDNIDTEDSAGAITEEKE